MAKTGKTPVTTPSTFRKGKTFLTDKKEGAGKFLTIAADSTVSVVPLVSLDEMVSAEMHEFWEVNPFVSHPCLGKGCPGCETGNEPKFKAYLPVATQEKDVKILAFGISVARQLAEIEDEMDDRSIAGQVIKIKRAGSGLRTKYTVVVTGKKVKIDEFDAPDIISALGSSDPEEIRQRLTDNGLLTEGAKPKKSTKKAVAEEESDDFSDSDSEWEEV